MPIYEYKCENNHVFDIMQKMADDSLTKCVECGAPVRKIMHPVGISFKGPGFYSTDYSGKSKIDSSSTDGSPSKSDSPDKSDSSSSNGDSKKNGDSSKDAKKSDSASTSSSSSSSKKE